MKKVYISGPMSGLPRDVYKARFKEAAVWLMANGYKVSNPAWFLPCRWPWLYKLLGYRMTLKYDLFHLAFCDHIYMMPGWETSKGAILEYKTAKTLPKPVTFLPIIEKQLLDEHMKDFINNNK